MTLARCNALALPLATGSVDLIVTSPPYFALRSYTDGGEHYDGQIGSEATPQEFIDALLAVTVECVRVLKPSGSLWVNLGDKYAGSGTGGGPSQLDGGAAHDRPRGDKGAKKGRAVAHPGIPTKSLMGLPWRYAIGCIDQLGLILRAEVIWSKPNGLPESVTDRVRRSHEQWFCFQQSGGEVVEAGAQPLPLCSLCGRPADTRATLVARLHEAEAGVENVDLPDDVRADERVQGESGGGTEQPGVVRPGGASVPLAVPVDPDLIEDATDLVDDPGVPVVDQDAEVGAPVPAVAEGHAALPVDDPGQPGDVCRCSHPLIIDDEPWIPQDLAAELMQMVADGEADAQAVADFLSGDFARSHSTWYHFTKEPRYFSAVDEIREDYSERVQDRQKYAGRDDVPRGKWSDGSGRHDGNGERGILGFGHRGASPLGKLPGSVWTVPTEPLRVPDHLPQHFAAFPSEWPRRIILGWSPSGICVECGEGRRPVTKLDPEYAAYRERTGDWNASLRAQENGYDGSGNRRADAAKPMTRSSTITGYACDCPTPDAPTRPAVVLDPFCGTGTTVAVANALGRHGVGIDLSADYLKVARWRCQDPKLRAKVLRVDPPPTQVAGQLDLLGGAA